MDWITVIFLLLALGLLILALVKKEQKQDIHVHVYNSTDGKSSRVSEAVSAEPKKASREKTAPEIPIEEPDRSKSWIEKEATDSNLNNN